MPHTGPEPLDKDTLTTPIDTELIKRDIGTFERQLEVLPESQTEIRKNLNSRLVYLRAKLAKVEPPEVAKTPNPSEVQLPTPTLSELSLETVSDSGLPESLSTTELTDHCENLSSQHANAPEQPTEGSGPSTPSTVPSGTNTESTIPSPEQSDTETTPAPINHKARRSSSSSSDSETDNSPNTYNPPTPAPITEEPKMADTLYKNYADIDNTVTYKEGRDAAELKRHLMYLKAEKDSKTKLLRTTRGLAEVTTNAITKQGLQQG